MREERKVYMQEHSTRKETVVQSHTHNLDDIDSKEEREPIIVSDQYGIVISWPDKHISRFFWSDLRQACPCGECQPVH